MSELTKEQAERLLVVAVRLRDPDTRWGQGTLHDAGTGCFCAVGLFALEAGWSVSSSGSLTHEDYGPRRGVLPDEVLPDYVQDELFVANDGLGRHEAANVCERFAQVVLG